MLLSKVTIDRNSTDMRGEERYRIHGVLFQHPSTDSDGVRYLGSHRLVYLPRVPGIRTFTPRSCGEVYGTCQAVARSSVFKT